MVYSFTDWTTFRASAGVLFDQHMIFVCRRWTAAEITGTTAVTQYVAQLQEMRSDQSTGFFEGGTEGTKGT